MKPIVGPAAISLILTAAPCFGQDRIEARSKLQDARSRPGVAAPIEERAAPTGIAGPATNRGIIVIGGKSVPAAPGVLQPGDARTQPSANPALNRAARTDLKQLSVSSQHRAARRQMYTMQLDAENRLAQQARGTTTMQEGPRNNGTVTADGRSMRSLPSPIGTSSRAGAQSGGAVATLNALPPGIWLINNKERDFLVTPGGYLTIAGKGFGDLIGQVNLIGEFPSGALALRVVEWRDGEVYALLPKEVHGVLDQQATLQVITRDARTYRRDGGKFIAAREEIEMTQNISRLVALEPDPRWLAQMDASGHVARLDENGVARCRQPGVDHLAFPKLANGYEVVGVSILAMPPKPLLTQAGSMNFIPDYAFGEWAGRLPIQWGVWEKTYQLSGRVECESGYRISAVAVYGPVGLSPL